MIKIMTYNNNPEDSLFIKDEEEQVKIVCGLKDDEEKISLLPHFKDEYFRQEIISSLQSDDKKLGLLPTLQDDYLKSLVVLSMSSDEKKISSFSFFSKRKYIKDILLSFKSNEKILSSLDLLPTYELYSVIMSMTLTNFERYSLLDRFDLPEYTKVALILQMTSTHLQQVSLSKLNDEYNKKKVILTFSDADKITYLDSFTKLDMQLSIIDSITDEDVKISYLDQSKNEFIKALLIRSLSDDKQKLVFLKQIHSEYNSVLIISSIDSDNLKVKFLNYLSDPDCKNLLIASISNLDLVQKLLNATPPSYHLNLPKELSIGLELESEGINSKYIYLLSHLLSRWSAVCDNSLNDGVEIVSPVLSNNEKDFCELYCICTLLKSLNQTANLNCGGHVHIGADYLKSKQAYINLFEIWGNSESILFQICNPENSTLRPGFAKHAKPFSQKLSIAIDKDSVLINDEYDLKQFVQEVQEIQENRYFSINVQNININNAKNTVEFRISNGTLDFETWIDNIRLYGKIIYLSEKLAEIEQSKEMSANDMRLIHLKQQLKEDLPEEQKLEILLDLLFDENEKDTYRKRYYSNHKIFEKSSNIYSFPHDRVDFGMGTAKALKNGTSHSSTSNNNSSNYRSTSSSKEFEK